MRVAIFIPSFGAGGVERMLVNTAVGLTNEGVTVDFLAGCRDGAYLDELVDQVPLEIVGPRSRLLRLLWLCRWLRRSRIDVIIAGKLNDAGIAVMARRLASPHTRVILRPGTTVSERLAKRGRLYRMRRYRRMRRIYAQADAVVANSEGVREDIAGITGMPSETVHLIRNPVITPAFHTLAAQPIEHPWLASNDGIPVILGAGGLRRQKDFETLIAAFARLRTTRRARLLILGEGQRRSALQRQADGLGVGNDCDLAGFVANPYPAMAAADLFVLSSRWEGSPNVLTEALALGTPVVATDCPSGPGEVLQQGQVAPVVPVGDTEAMAQAMASVLDNPPDPENLKAAVTDYTVEATAQSYRRLCRKLTQSDTAAAISPDTP